MFVAEIWLSYIWLSYHLIWPKLHIDMIKVTLWLPVIKVSRLVSINWNGCQDSKKVFQKIRDSSETSLTIQILTVCADNEQKLSD